MSTNEESRNLRKLSHALCWVLRHSARELGLPITADGYVPVQDILSCKHSKIRQGWTTDDIVKVVETNDKQRFKLEKRPASEFYSGNDDSLLLCIRANQGHTMTGIDSNMLLSALTPDELASQSTIVHGTYTAAWEQIRLEGLKCMQRNHIHFASGLPHDGEVISGMRKSCDTYVFIDGRKCAADRIAFYRSDNGVLLSSGLDGTIPPRYFSRVTTSSGSVLLDQTTHSSTNDQSSS